MDDDITRRQYQELPQIYVSQVSPINAESFSHSSSVRIIVIDEHSYIHTHIYKELMCVSMIFKLRPREQCS